MVQRARNKCAGISTQTRISKSSSTYAIPSSDMSFTRLANTTIFTLEEVQQRSMTPVRSCQLEAERIRLLSFLQHKGFKTDFMHQLCPLTKIEPQGTQGTSTNCQTPKAGQMTARALRRNQSVCMLAT